ncbi:MAG: HlyD family secretion protein, partial [Nostoc sp.]
MAQTASTTTDSLPNAPVLPSKVRPRLLSLPSLLVVVLALAAGIGYTIWRSQGQPRTDVIHVNGRMEGYETEIGVKRGGRIEWIGVREGTAVK